MGECDIGFQRHDLTAKEFVTITSVLVPLPANFEEIPDKKEGGITVHTCRTSPEELRIEYSTGVRGASDSERPRGDVQVGTLTYGRAPISLLRSFPIFFIKHSTVCVSVHFGLVVRIPPFLVTVLPLCGEETLLSAITHFSPTHQLIPSPILFPHDYHQTISCTSTTAFVIVSCPSFQAGDAAMSSLGLQLLKLVFKTAYCEVRPGHVL